MPPTSRPSATSSRTFDRVVADFGRLDGSIANAGILRDGLLVKAKDGEVTGKLSLEQWQAVIDVNLTGVFLCGREAAERMIRLRQRRLHHQHLEPVARRQFRPEQLLGGQGRRRGADRRLGQGARAP